MEKKEKKCGENKWRRILYLYEILNRGEAIKKETLALELRVDRKSIQRDIEDLRTYLADMHIEEQSDIVYNRSTNEYILTKSILNDLLSGANHGQTDY